MSKLRITRYQADNSVISDRLVEAQTEFASGPSEIHYEGPLRLDMLLSNQAEVDQLITYLSQLMGQLPISEKVKKIPKTLKVEKNTLDQLITDVVKKNKCQEDLLDYLRGLNFALVTFDHFRDIGRANQWMDFEIKEGKEKFHAQYQVMVRQLRVAKDPKNDKFDSSVVFLIKLISPRVAKYHIYVNGKFSQTVPLEWKDKGEINFKVKEKFYKFPKIMTYEERSKWRLEDRKVNFTPGYTPTSLYTKYKEHVTILQPIRK